MHIGEPVRGSCMMWASMPNMVESMSTVITLSGTPTPRFDRPSAPNHVVSIAGRSIEIMKHHHDRLVFLPVEPRQQFHYFQLIISN